MGLFCTAAFASATCQITITNVQMCNGSGVVTPWAYNWPDYWVLVNWTVTGTPTAPYNASVTFGDAAPMLIKGFTGTGFTGAGNFAMIAGTSYPSLFTFPVKVVLDPGNVSGNTTPATATLTKSFRASWPSTVITNYGTQTLFGKQTMTVPVTSGTVGKLVLLLSKPVTDTFQTVVSDTSTGTPLVSQPNGYPVLESVLTNAGVGTYTLAQSFQTSASNVAVNPSLLNATTWAQIDGVKTTMANFLGTEPNIEPTNAQIVAFVNGTLPPNYRATLSPLVVAERLYSAVVNRTVYQTPANGDAVVTFNAKVGDCGSMSDLYDACLRVAGIPCRNATGWLVGNGLTHVWSEIFFPGAGWFPADTSFARKTSPTCMGLPFFGYLPTCNQRCAVCRVGKIITPDMNTGSVQVGALGITNGPTPSTVGSMSWTTVLGTTPIP